MAATQRVFRPLWRPATANLFTTRLQPLRIPYTAISRTFHSSPSQLAYRRGFDYQRFQNTSGLLRRWADSPYFYYHIAFISFGVGGVYVYNLETVPVSGRRRFNVISPSFEKQQGDAMYESLVEEYKGRILPPSDARTKMVKRVLDRLVPHSGLDAEHNTWQIHVIDDETKNAFVIPGGKVFVFAGILDVCRGDDGLAAVLGHEIAHNVAHHAAEKMSQTGVVMMSLYSVLTLLGGVDFFQLTQVLVDIGFMRPNGRKQESEADYIGLMMMAQACYNPEQAVELWRRMEKAEEHAPPQFLSTHPSSHNRIEAITTWLDEARAKQEQAGCGVASGFADDFRNTFEQWRSV